jgi:hypothetical protein
MLWTKTFSKAPLKPQINPVIMAIMAIIPQKCHKTPRKNGDKKSSETSS